MLWHKCLCQHKILFKHLLKCHSAVKFSVLTGENMVINFLEQKHVFISYCFYRKCSFPYITEASHRRAENACGDVYSAFFLNKKSSVKHFVPGRDESESMYIWSHRNYHRSLGNQMQFLSYYLKEMGGKRGCLDVYSCYSKGVSGNMDVLQIKRSYKILFIYFYMVGMSIKWSHVDKVVFSSLFFRK